MSFTMASDQEERPSLRIGGEKYYVVCSPGRVRCNNAMTIMLGRE